MKIDMHCHVKEGSIDSRVGIEEYIEILKKKGFQGMVITDHDTYNGYRYWKENIKGKKHTDFVVLKGIEYDTRDAGHILVIMPEGVKIRLLEMRGMPLALLIDLVHRNGGVLGPAHPCGEKYMSFTHARKFYQSPEIIKRFDFVEGFNSCETTESNAGAMKLAKKYGKPVLAFSGSVTEDAASCNEAGIDAFFPILRQVTTLEDAMDPQTAQKNMESAVEQVFRVIRLKERNW